MRPAEKIGRLPSSRPGTATRVGFSALRTILPDYTVTTPEKMQALAAKYLLRDKAWSFVVLPEEAPAPSGR